MTTLKQVPKESHARLLYVMMATWLRSKLVRDSVNYDPVNQRGTICNYKYMDSHAVSEIYRHSGPRIEVDEFLRHEEKDYIVVDNVHEFKEDSQMIDLVIPTDDRYEAAFIAHHIKPRICKDSPFNFDYDVGDLGINVVAFPNLSERFDPDMVATTPEFKRRLTPGMMLSAIINFVRDMRLETEFDSMIDIFSKLTFIPRPDTTEGCLWELLPTELVLPKFFSLRSKCTVFLESAPYKFDATALTPSSDYADLFTRIVNGGIVNYKEYLGMYIYAHHRTKECIAKMKYLAPHTSNAAYISLIENTAVKVKILPGAGVVRDVNRWLEIIDRKAITIKLAKTDKVAYQDYIKTGSLPTADTDDDLFVTVKTVPAPANLMALAGKVPPNLVDYSYLNGGSYSFQPATEHDDIMQFDFKEMLALTNYMRGNKTFE